MNETQISKEYADNKGTYVAYLEVLQTDIQAFFITQHPTTDIFDIYGRVKDIPSLLLKAQKRGTIDDIVGVTVVCHCRSDAERAVVVLGDYLPTQYKDFKYAQKDVNGYKAHHFNFKASVGGIDLACEIQVKTILQDAWGAQSHKYLYKKPKEGDADILARTMSGIFDNCENLWELVKKSVQDNGTQASIEPIADNVAKQVAELQKTMPPQQVITGSFTEEVVSLLKGYSSSDKADLEEILESEIKKIKEEWLQSHPQTSTIEGAKTLLEKSEASVKDLTVLGLYAIKYERLEFLKKILNCFVDIANTSQDKAGLAASISIPSAVLHNMYYYFGAYSIAKKRVQALDLLINYQMEITSSNGTYYLMHIWSNASIMAPEIVQGADHTFDRLKKGYPNEDERIRTLIESDNEKFTDLIIQFNFLFTIRGEQLIEEGSTSHIWNYPNFGRFYGFRVLPLLNRMLKHPDYSDFVESVFKIEAPELRAKLPVWLAALVKKGRGGGNYWWESIEKID